MGTLTTKTGTITASGTADIYLRKYDSNLNELWTVVVGGSGQDGNTNIALTNDGILLLGALTGTCQFSSTVSLTSVGAKDAFLAKYNLDGEFMWAKRIAAGNFTTDKTPIVVDNADGSILVGGRSSNSITFDGEASAATPAAGIYYAKLRSDGTRLWHITATGIAYTGGIVLTENGYAFGGTLRSTQTLTLGDKTTQSITRTAGGDKDYGFYLLTDKDGRYDRHFLIEGKLATDMVSVQNSVKHGNSFVIASPYNGTSAASGITVNGQETGIGQSQGQDVYILEITPDGNGFTTKSQVISAAGSVAFGEVRVVEDILYVAGGLPNEVTFNLDVLGKGIALAAYDFTATAIRPIGAVNKMTCTGTVFSSKSIDFTPKGMLLSGQFNGTLNVEGFPAVSVLAPAQSAYLVSGALIALADSVGGKNVQGYDADAENGELELEVRGLPSESQYSVILSSEKDGVLEEIRNQKNVKFTGLGTGTYTVKLTWNEGHNNRTYTYHITAPDAFGVDGVEVEDADCADAAPVGAIRVTAHHGSGTSLRYSITQTDGGSHAAANEDGIFADCPAGEYDVLVELLDAGEAVLADTTLTTQVLQTSLTPAFTFGTIQTVGYDCNRANSGPGLTGEISVVITGPSQEWAALQDAATGAVTMRYDLADNNIAFTQVPPGKYLIVAGTGLCVQYSDEIDLSEPAAVIVSSIDAIAIDCKGNDNGSITVTASGGTGALRYSLYPSVDGQPDRNNPVAEDQPANTFGDLPAGDYIIVVRDERGCEVQKPAVVNEGYDIALSVVNTQDACAEKDNGQLTVSASGSPSGAYSFYLYPWGGVPNAAPDNTTGYFAGRAPGEYDVKVVDHVYGCSATLSEKITVARLAPVTFDPLVQTKPLCYGGSDGKITVNNIAGGMGVYHLTLTKGPATITHVTISENTYEFTGLNAGTYMVAITDEYTCSGGSKEIEVTQPDLLTATVGAADITDVLCYGDNTGAFTVHAAGGTVSGLQPYKYELYQGSTPLSDPQAENIFRDLYAGTGYEIKVVDANGCEAYASSLNINQPAEIVVSIVDQTHKDINCKKEAGHISVFAEGGWSGFQYSLRGAEGDNAVTDFSIDPGISIQAAGTYTVKARDSKGCMRNSGSIAVRDTSVKEFTVNTKNECNANDDGTIMVTTSESGMIYSLAGFKPEQSPSEFTGLEAGNYKVMLKNQYFCKDSTDITIVATSLNFAFDVKNAPNASGGGSVTITTVTGGGSPYTYNFDNTGTNALNAPQTIPNVKPGIYSLVVTDNGGCSINHPATVELATGFEDLKPTPALKIYPNPSDGRFNIEWDTRNDTRVTVEIIGMSGQVVYKTTTQTGTGGVRTYIDLSNHAKGTYILHVPEMNVRQRIVVQ